MMVGDIIKELRKKHKLTQADLAKRLGIAPTAVSAWERNENRPLMDKISILAEMFGVPVSYFFDSNEFDSNIDGIINLPIVGRISCGNGVIAYEDIEGYEPTPKEWLNGGEYFYLIAKGDSMTGVRIFEGDKLLIRKQATVESGEIAAVLLNGEDAVLKRVYRNGSQLVLQSENPNYPPIFAPPTEARIIGKLKKVVIDF